MSMPAQYSPEVPLNLPQFSAVAGLAERAPGDRRRVIVDASPDGRERDFGDQDRGDDDDTGFASAGPVGVGNRRGERDRPQDGAQIHCARARGSGLPTAQSRVRR